MEKPTHQQFKQWDPSSLSTPLLGTLSFVSKCSNTAGIVVGMSSMHSEQVISHDK